MEALIGRKLGMTRIFSEEGIAVPVTAIEVGPCTVLQIKTLEKDGYTAVQIGFEEKKKSRATKPEVGHAKKHADTTAKQVVREFRIEDTSAYQPGQVLTAELLADWNRVDVIGTTKGRGYSGGFKRFGFHGSPSSHGTEKTHRQIGSVGRAHSTNKGIMPGKKMPGQFGNERRTQKSIPIIKLLPQANTVLVRGGIPGPDGGIVLLQKSVKQAALQLRLRQELTSYTGAKIATRGKK